jgi:hypothetical protein
MVWLVEALCGIVRTQALSSAFSVQSWLMSCKQFAALPLLPCDAIATGRWSLG